MRYDREPLRCLPRGYSRSAESGVEARLIAPDSIDPSDWKTEQVFYNSKDGTRVPMFIVSPKEAQRDGTAPTILCASDISLLVLRLADAYGGFSISIEPTFSPSWMSWLALTRGAVAVANIRGGGASICARVS